MRRSNFACFFTRFEEIAAFTTLNTSGFPPVFHNVSTRQGCSSNRGVCGGPRSGGSLCESAWGIKAAFCLRWLRICEITAGSSILAITFSCPPQHSQVSISIWKTRFSRCIQVIAWWRSSDVFSSQLFTPVTGRLRSVTLS